MKNTLSTYSCLLSLQFKSALLWRILDASLSSSENIQAFILELSTRLVLAMSEMVSFAFS